MIIIIQQSNICPIPRILCVFRNKWKWYELVQNLALCCDMIKFSYYIKSMSDKQRYGQKKISGLQFQFVVWSNGPGFNWWVSDELSVKQSKGWRIETIQFSVDLILVSWWMSGMKNELDRNCIVRKLCGKKCKFYSLGRTYTLLNVCWPKMCVFATIRGLSRNI